METNGKTNGEATKEKYYLEAIRYLENAKEILKKAGIDGKYYQDAKYVKMAAGTAYSGVLLALDGYFKLKGVQKRQKGRLKKEFYTEELAKLDRRMLNSFHTVYEILHLSGYYDGILNSKIIKEGLEEAKSIVDKLK